MGNRLSKITIRMLLCLIWFFSASSFADFNGIKPLPANQAFQLAVSVKHPDKIEVRFQVKPGYYLYANRLHISFTPAVSANIQYPHGQWQRDGAHKSEEVYRGNFTIPITLHTDAAKLQIMVAYQGCSKEGFCYPPTHQSLALQLAATGVLTPAIDLGLDQSLLTSHLGIQSLLHTQHPAIFLLIFLGIGLLLAFTPCVLPMIPILTGIILGQQHAVGTKKAFFLSATYVLGMAIAYAVAGIVAASLGSSLQVWMQNQVVISVVTALFVLLAFSLFGWFELRVSRHWQNAIANWSNRHQGGTYVGVFFMGLLSTLVVSPCVTAPLVGVLIYIGESGNVFWGACALFTMGIGMGLPLILIGVSEGKFLPKSGAWMRVIKEMFGLLMLAMAIWMLSRIISHTVVLLLSSVLLLITALFFGIHLPRHIGQHPLNRSVGVVFAVVAVLVMLGGIGMTSVVDRLLGNTFDVQPVDGFTVVRNMTDLNQQLAQAQAAKRPVMLDFYADWCESCVEMQQNVFAQGATQSALKNFVLIRVDISENSAADEEMLQKLGVIAPPTMVFFNKDGKEVSSRRIIGYLNAEAFIGRITLFLAAGCDKNAYC